MRISSKSHYAVRAMIELALEYNRGYLQLKVIAQRHGISKKFLEQIFILLRAKGLVDSQRGYSGGFVLSRPPREITVYDILEALENTMSPVECIDHPETCDRHSYCVTRKVWDGLRNRIHRELSAINLAALAEAQAGKGPCSADSYIYHI